MNIQVEVKQIGRATAQGQARTHTVLIDRPLDKGSCFMSNLLAAIHARGADIQDVQLQVRGTLGSAPSRFSDIEVLVSAQAEDRELPDKLIVIADRACISSNTLRPAVNLSFRAA